MSTRFLTGQRLTADLLNTNVADFMPSTFVKAADQSRNTSITLADDAELAGIPLSVGTWEIELVLFYTVASTTPLLKTAWAFSGTWGTSALRAVVGPNGIVAPSVATPANMQAAPLTTAAVYNSSTAGSYSSVREIARNVVVTVAGNLSLQWAQSVSNASNVTVRAATSFGTRKIS